MLFSQNVKRGEVYAYARKVVDTMASASMHGRGYVMGGDSIAANYLRTEFQKLGLEKLTDNYYQRFSFPINTFPDTVYFEFNLHNLKTGEIFNFIGSAGKNFIINPSSPSVKRDIPVFVFDSTFCSEKAFKKFGKKVDKNPYSRDFILVDDRNVKDKNKLAYFNRVKSNEFNCGGVIELSKKLTWSQSQEVSDFVKIQILQDSIPYSNSDYKSDGGGGICITQKFLPKHPSQNVIGYVKGSQYPDSFIVFSAHYDHLGHMGEKAYFPGANDNASGCAMLLNLAKHYAKPENKPKYSIVFMAFAGEEVGILGSQYYTEHPLVPLKNTKFVFNMDLMGTGDDGIMVVNGAIFNKEFEKLKQLNTDNNYLKDVKMRGKAANSDHYYFSEKGVKSFFIYTMGGIAAYHDIYDKPETLPLTEFEDLFQLIIKFGDYLQQ